MNTQVRAAKTEAYRYRLECEWQTEKADGMVDDVVRLEAARDELMDSLGESDAQLQKLRVLLAESRARETVLRCIIHENYMNVAAQDIQVLVPPDVRPEDRPL